jgi:hypothetical protein
MGRTGLDRMVLSWRPQAYAQIRDDLPICRILYAKNELLRFEAQRPDAVARGTDGQYCDGGAICVVGNTIVHA